MNLTRKSSTYLFAIRPGLSCRNVSSSGASSGDKPGKDPPNITEAQSYEKWNKDLQSFRKDAMFRLDYYKEALLNFGTKKSNEEWYAERVSFWMKRYENFVGLTEVKAAQALVVKEERLFVQAQEQRRATQAGINEVQAKLKTLRSELERTPRGEDKYLELITEEHSIIKEENALTLQLQTLERTEREKFSKMSASVRDSHEKERAQAEKTKYWSVLGSVIGTCLGLLGATINNRMRMKELRQIVTDSTQVSNSSGASSSTVAIASTAPLLTMSALESQQKQLEAMSESFLEILSKIDTKMEGLGKAVQDNISKPKKEDKPLPSLEPKIEALEISLTKILNDLQNNLFHLNGRLIDNLGKTISERDDKFIENLDKTIESNYNSFSSRVCEMEEKVKDIRSLLLAQSMNTSNSAITSSVKNQEAFKAVERSNKSIVGTVEFALKEHEERISGHIVAAGLTVAVLVPIVTIVVNKIF